MRIALRPTTADDVALCGVDPIPFPSACLTMVAAGEVIGFGGIVFSSDGQRIACAEFLSAARRYPVAIHRLGLTVMAAVRRAGLTHVDAYADPTCAASQRWLLRLGFRPAEGERFIWEA